MFFTVFTDRPLFFQSFSIGQEEKLGCAVSWYILFNRFAGVGDSPPHFSLRIRRFGLTDTNHLPGTVQGMGLGAYMHCFHTTQIAEIGISSIFGQ